MEEKNIKSEFNLDIDVMTEAGLQFWHRASKVNPKMKPYISGVRNGVHIIDLNKTIEKLDETLRFIQKAIMENKVFLVWERKFRWLTWSRNLPMIAGCLMFRNVGWVELLLI
jgi:ribosomal protein S2